MRVRNILKTVATGGFGLALLLTAQTASAQNRNEEYREWQAAQRRAQNAQRDYQRTRSSRDYREWQQAHRRAQQEYNEYIRSNNRASNRYNNNNGRRVGWYRINRGGNYYEVNQPGYNMLREAVNRGYQQGYNAGQRDQRSRRGDSWYRNDNVYRSGTYGYRTGVDRSQYQYYFQQGFERGYRDGYNNSYSYGTRSNAGLSVLGTVLNQILQVVD